MSAPSLIGLGSSALHAYRNALSVTSNNISNVGVEGYSRQRADLGMNDAMQTYAGFMGNGVETVEVARTYDNFLTSNLNTATSSFNHYDTYHSYASTIDEIVADPEMGMTPVMTSFFNSLQDLSSAPASIPARQVVQGEGEALVTRFNTIFQEMQTVREQTMEEMGAVVTKINGISQSIAELNIEIKNVSAGNVSHTKQPNELLDQRERLVKELSEYIGVTISEQDGMATVLIGKGQALVTGGAVNELTLGDTQYREGDSLNLYMKMGNHHINITSAIKGGVMGGVVDFTNEILNPSQNSLGRMAIAMAATMNAHHRDGFGVGGESDTGREFFDIGQIATSNGVSALKLDNVVADSNSKAQISISIPMNNSEVTVGPVGTSAVTGLVINGYRIEDTASASTSAGAVDALVEKINAESYRTNVTAKAEESGKITLMSDEDIVVSTATGGDIDASGLTDGTYRMLKSSMKALTADDYAITYADGNYVITNQTTNAQRVLNSTEALALKNPNVNGGVVVDGLTFQLNVYEGDMKEGDRILVMPTRKAAFNIDMAISASEINSIAASSKANEPGNNDNLLRMVSLQSEKLMLAGENGKATSGFQDSYGQMVADIGVQAHYADINRISQESILRNAQADRDNNASVNLDEEAANLMKFQQMYQASTKIVSMADKMFQSILNAV